MLIRNTWKGYLFAIAVSVAAILLKIPIAELIGYETPLALFPVAVLFITWFGGLGPGLLSIALKTAAATFFFIDPVWSFAFDPSYSGRIIVFLMESVIFCGLVVLVHRSRERLNQSKQHTADVLGSINDVFFAVDEDWRLTYINENTAELTGRSPDELVGHNVWDVFPDFVGTPIETCLRKAMRERTPVHLEVQGVLTDNWYEGNVYPFTHGLSVYGRSITERRRVELELRENQKRLDLALQAASMDAWEWNRETGRLITTDVFEKAYGIPSPQSVEESRELVHPDDRKRHSEALQRAIDEGGTYYIDYRIVHPENGKVIWLEERGRAEENQDGEVWRVIGTSVDITGRKKAEEVLLRQANMLELAHDAIYIWRLDGRVEFWNRGAEELYGFSAGEAYGQNVRELLQTRATLPCEEIKEILMEDGQWEGECVDTTKAGREVVVSTRMQLVEEPDGDLVVLETSRDITARKRYEEALEEEKHVAQELAQAKTALLADMSHEVRTPLTGLLLMAEILSNRITGKNREKVLRLKKGAEKLSNLLNGVLTLSRLEAGKVNLSCEVLDLSEEVEHAAASLLPLAEQKGLSFVVESNEPCYAHADEPSINSVLNNLIGNAIKFTNAGSVTVTIENDEDQRVGGEAVILRVRDTGCGIAEEFLPHVFDEFRQENPGNGRKKSGAGLGLAISKRLVDLMGGVIEVESQLGEGTTFILTLPRAEVEGDAQYPPAASQAVTDGPSPHVLMMDDDELVLELCATLLEGTHQVTTASTPDEALKLAAEGRYDVFLLDISMGAELTGEDVLRKLREMPVYQSVPIIAVTAYALSGDEARFLKAGFDGYLSKPFEKAALVHALETATMMADTFSD